MSKNVLKYFMISVLWFTSSVNASPLPQNNVPSLKISSGVIFDLLGSGSTPCGNYFTCNGEIKK